MFTYELGESVRDGISGFAGRIIGRVEYVTGANRYGVQPRTKPDGEMIEAEWFDEDRLERGP